MNSPGELLGVSVLELRTDQAPLDKGLAEALRKVGLFDAAMQAQMDRSMLSIGQRAGRVGDRFDQQLIAPLTRAEKASKAAGGTLSSSMAAGTRATADAALKLQGYQLAVAGAQTRVTKLSEAVRSGKGDQAALNDALQLAQGRLTLAQGRMQSYAEKTAHGAQQTRALYGSMGPLGARMDQLQGHASLLKTHGVDYLAGGVLALETAFVGLSVRAAVRFEELTNTVGRETGLTGKALDGLMSVIRTIARDSPYQIQQVADAAVVLRQEFGASNTQIGAWANAMIAFSKATGQDVRPQMQQLARIMTDYRQPLSNVVGLTDKLVSVAQATQQPIDGITSALDRFGPKLQAMGFGLDDSVRLLGLFQASGIKADQMGRGLSAALTDVTKAQSANQKLLADGPGKLQGYAIAVQSAQLRVDRLSQAHATAKTTQADLDAEMQIAQERLAQAKGKYDTLNTALKGAKQAHIDVAASIRGEISDIVHAKSRQDAMNIAVADFGKNLGPSMARAYYNNEAALKKVDDALHTTGATQHLFGIDQASIAGKTQEAKNNFQDLEITIGTKVVPALSTLLGWVRTGIHDIDKFVAHNRTLVEVLGGVAGLLSTITLASRHITPLGNLLGGLAQGSGSSRFRTGVASVLTGGGSGVGINGVRGPVGGGSLRNPVAVAVVDGGIAGLGSNAAPGTSLGTGGGRSSSGTVPTTAGAGLGAEEEKVSSGLVSSLKSGLSRAMAGGMFALLGSQISSMIGGAVGGGMGKGISSIGTDASIGAGVGMMFGPEGAIGGALIGGMVGSLTSVLGGGNAEREWLSKATSSSRQWGNEIADAATAGLPAAVKSRYGSGLAQALTQAQLLSREADREMAIAQAQSRVPFGNASQSRSLAGGDTLEAVLAYTKAGKLAAQAWSAGFDSVKVKTEYGLFQSVRTQMAALPPAARGQAALTMLRYAESLQQNGTLPKGSVTKLIAQLEGQFPALTRFLAAQGGVNDQALAAGFKLTRTQAVVAQAITNVQSEFGLMNDGVSTTVDNMNLRVQETMTALRDFIAHSSGQAKQDAIDQYNTLKALQGRVLDDILVQTEARMGNIASTVKTNATAAQVNAQIAFDRLAGNVIGAMKAGTVATGDGMKIIAQGLNATLTAFGVKPLPVALVEGMNPQEALSWLNYQFTGGTGQTGNAGHGAKAEGGGVFQIGRAGDAGRDTIPMSVGGQDLMVGSGEVAAIFNRHQLPDINARLADEGGLAGWFANRKRPHYLASGGVVTASMFGGAGDPLTGSSGYRGDNLYQHPDSFAELSPGGTGVDGALGYLPYLTPLDVTYAGRTARLLKRDVGRGGSGLNGHVRAIDLWFQAAAALGFPGLADVLVNGPAGVNVQIAGGGGQATQITAPKVKGGGTVGQIVQAALDKVAAAANSYVTAHMPAVNTTVTGGAASGQPGLAVFEGVTMSKWIADELIWATQHGWSGQPTSGYRPGRDPHTASGTSEHALIDYPGGAVDFGGYTDPAAYATKLALVDLAQRLNYPGPRLLMPIGFHDDGHLSGTGHAEGGLVGAASGGMFASGGTKYRGARPKAPRWRAKTGKPTGPVIPKAIKAPKPKKPAALPHLKQLKAFDQTLLNEIYQLNSVTVPELGAWQGYLSGLHGRIPLAATLTLADGSEMVNWGSDDPKVAIGALTGARDPATGSRTKAIRDRLREIGDPGAHPNRTATRDKRTELGTEELILDNMLSEQRLAAIASRKLRPWLRKTGAAANLEAGQFAWLTKALDVNAPLPRIGTPEFSALFEDLGSTPGRDQYKRRAAPEGLAGLGGVYAALARGLSAGSSGSVSDEGVGVAGTPVAAYLFARAREFKDVIARIARWNKLKQLLPLQRQKREAKLAARFALARHRISNASATSAFTAHELKSHQLAGLSREEQDARHGIPSTPPSDWVGSKAAWSAQRRSELAQVGDEFGLRRQELEYTFSGSSFAGRLSKSNALFALSQGEAAEKLALSQRYGYERVDLANKITAANAIQSTDKSYLAGLKASISKTHTQDVANLSAATGQGGFADTLKAYLDPMGTLHLSVLQAQNIDVPNLLDEIRSLTGTKLTATPTQDQAQLIGLLQTEVATLGQQLAVLNAQSAVLANLPAFGGSFAAGGVVPGMPGEARTIVAHGGERYLGIGEHDRGGGDVHVHIDRKSDLDKLIDVRIETHTRGSSRTAGRFLPSAGGGRMGRV